MYDPMVPVYKGTMITWFLLSAITLVVLGWLLWAYPEPIRVQKLVLGDHTTYYVEGTVEGQTDLPLKNGDGHQTQWTIRWDDRPQIFETMPAHNFIWHRGHWTLLTK